MLGLLFFGSGCAALIYEVVWFQLLQLIVGSSALSLSVLLGAFMGGTCLGSLLSGRLLRSSRHPLRVYALLELAIGVSGILILSAAPLLGDVYFRIGGGHIVVRALIAGLCLLPPTMAMGATLPVIARWRADMLGVLYTANLIGAIVGSLLAGFYLLRVFDAAVASWVAVGINAAVALVAWRSDGESSASPEVGSACGAHAVYVSIALSGLTALSAQVLWTRVLALSFGATTYTFSLVLAAFLGGLGVGSAIGTAVSRRQGTEPRVALGWCQVALVVAIAWGAYLLSEVMPYWQGNDLVRTLAVVTPGAILWGASFPLALAAFADTAGITAANTAGALIGSLGTSGLLAMSIGTQRIEQVLIVVAAASGLAVLRSKHRNYFEWAAIGVSAAVLAFGVAPVPGVLIAFGRGAAQWLETSKRADTGRILYQGEGVNEFVAVSQGSGGELTFHAAGKVQASTLAPDMRLQLLLAHLSHLVPKSSAEVLVIGCGAGITAGALATGPGVQHMTIAEIEPLVPQAASRFFGAFNHEVLQDPRVTVHIDDGRHFLATTDQTFDVITTDLVDPWVKGVAALFTREFFETAKRHLRPGGVVTQFVQLYQSNREAVKSEIGTFVEAFPNAVIWGNPREGEGYDLVLVGQKDAVRIDVDEVQARLESAAYSKVAASLGTVGIRSAVELLKSYAGSGPGLRAWLNDAAINRDINLRLQYLAGLGVGMDESAKIYSEILQRAKYPADMFQGSSVKLAELRSALEAEWRR